MKLKAALAGAIPLLALIAWAPGCESSDTPPAGYDVAPVEGAIEDDAVAIVKGAVELLRETDSFSVSMDTGFDVVQSDGQKIEFGALRKAVITRPDLARFETDRRDGKAHTVVFDGSTISAFSATHEVYAQSPQPGGVDASIEYLAEELGIAAPMADLYASDVGSSLADGLVSCYIVGESAIAGVSCDHVAVRNEYADFQMWIAKGDQPLLARIVISYREEPGEPQFWANFLEWNLAPETDATTYVFETPEGAERINFADIRPQEEE